MIKGDSRSSEYSSYGSSVASACLERCFVALLTLGGKAML